MVLVDSRNEFFADQARIYNERFFETQHQNMNQFLSKIGIVRLLGKTIFPDAMPDYLSPEKYVNVHWDTPFFKVLNEEIEQIDVSEKLLEETQHLGDLPLKIITPSDVELQATELGFTSQEERNLENKWLESQRKLTDLSTNGEFIEVKNSSHSVMYDQPSIIIDAILKMAEK